MMSGKDGVTRKDGGERWRGKVGGVDGLGKICEEEDGGRGVAEEEWRKKFRGGLETF